MLFVMKGIDKPNKAMDDSFELIAYDPKNSIVSVEPMGYILESEYTLDQLRKNNPLWRFQVSHVNPRKDPELKKTEIIIEKEFDPDEED